MRLICHPSLILAGALLCTACSRVMPAGDPAIAPHFRSLSRPDSLHFAVANPEDTLVSGDTIPNRLFFTIIPEVLLREIDYLADSSQALVLGRQRFAWNDSLDAYWVDIRQHWFQHQSLLLYHPRRQAFVARVTVAEWYGGDGGQVLTGSWMLDYDGDGRKDIVRREIEHTMVPDGEEVRELLHESAVLLVWSGDRFVEQPLADSSLTAKRFPLKTPW